MKINANCSPMEGLNPSLSCLYQELELWLTAAMEPGKGVTGIHDRLGGIFQGRVQPRVAEGLAALVLGKETCSGCFLNWKLLEKERVGYFGHSPRPLDPCISKDSELRWPRTFGYKIPMQTQPIQASKGNRGYDKQSPFVLHSPLRCSPELPSIPTHTFTTWLLPPSTLQLDLLSSLQHSGVQAWLCCTLDAAAFQHCLHRACASGADASSGAAAGLEPVHSHPWGSSWVCTWSGAHQRNWAAPGARAEALGSAQDNSRRAGHFALDKKG